MIVLRLQQKRSSKPTNFGDWTFSDNSSDKNCETELLYTYVK